MTKTTIIQPELYSFCEIVYVCSTNDGLFLKLKVECSEKDLHSGVFGGSVHEAMTDLIALMGK